MPGLTEAKEALIIECRHYSTLISKQYQSKGRQSEGFDEFNRTLEKIIKNIQLYQDNDNFENNVLIPNKIIDDLSNLKGNYSHKEWFLEDEFNELQQNVESYLNKMKPAVVDADRYPVTDRVIQTSAQRKSNNGFDGETDNPKQALETFHDTNGTERRENDTEKGIVSPDVSQYQSTLKAQAEKLQVFQAGFPKAISQDIEEAELLLGLLPETRLFVEEGLQEVAQSSDAKVEEKCPAFGLTSADSSRKSNALEGTATPRLVVEPVAELTVAPATKNVTNLAEALASCEASYIELQPFTPILEHNLEKNATTGQQKATSSSFNIDNTKGWFKEARNQAVTDREVIDREITDEEVDDLFKSGAIAMDNEGQPQKMFYTKDLDKEKTIFFAAVTLEGISKSQPDTGDLVKATVEGCDDNEKFLLDVLTTFHERLNKQLNGKNPGKVRCTTIEYIGTSARLSKVIEEHNKFAEIINKEGIENIAIATKKVKSASIINEIKVAKEMLLQEVEEPHSTSTAHHRKTSQLK